MKHFLFSPTLALTVLTGLPCFADVLVFKDGSRITTGHYEIRGQLVVFVKTGGRLFSVPADYLDLEATARLNHRPSDGTQAPTAPEPAPPTSRPGATTLLPQIPAVGSEPISLPEPPVRLDESETAASPLVAPPTPGRTDVLAGDREGIKGTRAEQALELIGVTELLDTLPAEANFQAEQLTTLWRGSSTDDNAFLRRRAERAFAPESIGAVVAESFARRAPEPHLRIGMDFLLSPLWQRMRALEQSSETQEGASEFTAFRTKLSDDPPSGRQLQIATRMDKALGLSRMHVELRMEILGALLEGVRRLAQAELGTTDEDAKRWVARTRTNLTKNAESAAVASVLFDYRSLSDEELSECLEFWESDVGHSLRDAAEESLLDGVRVGAARLRLLLTGALGSDDRIPSASAEP